jgi:hypothetical protein
MDLNGLNAWNDFMESPQTTMIVQVRDTNLDILY